jgi:hypothetical protein
MDIQYSTVLSFGIYRYLAVNQFDFFQCPQFYETKLVAQTTKDMSSHSTFLFSSAFVSLVVLVAQPWCSHSFALDFDKIVLWNSGV